MRYGISIIGGGRIGRALGRRLREKGWKIHAVVTQSLPTAQRAVRSIGGGHARAAITSDVLSAPVLLLCVPDTALQGVVAQLASLGVSDMRGRAILHTSGTLDSQTLAPLRELGAGTASLHPLQTFSGIGIPPLEGRIFVVEGDRRGLRMARLMARALGGQIVQMAQEKKPLYHAAAVMAAGQVLALEEAALQLLVYIGMKRREALKALLPLTRQVLENLEVVGPRAAWTGPLARSDYGVIAAHEAALQSAPPGYLEAYRALSRLAARVLARDPDAILSELSRISSKLEDHSKSKGTNA